MKDKNESFQHHAAKQLFASWLRQTAEPAGDAWVDFCGIAWRVNRGAPHYGVMEEYPLTISQATVWDEQDVFFMKNEWPTYEWMKRNSKEKFRIADIAIQHKGWITEIIEIVHKSDVSSEKLDFYRQQAFHPAVYAIPAQWIMGQVTIPTVLPYNFKIL